MDTLIYQLVDQCYPAFVMQLAAEGKILPDNVHQEFDGYLKCGRIDCGRLEHGFLRVQCGSCHAEQLVAFGCKRRGFCRGRRRSSCGARRMAESAALLVDEAERRPVLPHRPMRQWVLSVPHPLRFLFASQPKVMGKVPSIVYRTLVTHLIHKAGHRKSEAHTGAVTLIQRFGGSLDLNSHFHMLFLDGVYVDRGGKLNQSRWVKAPSTAELSQLTYSIAHRIGRFLERQGLLVRDAEQSYLALDASEQDPEHSMNQLQQGHSITYRLAAVGAHQGRKVFTLADPVWHSRAVH